MYVCCNDLQIIYISFRTEISTQKSIVCFTFINHVDILPATELNMHALKTSFTHRCEYTKQSSKFNIAKDHT